MTIKYVVIKDSTIYEVVRIDDKCNYKVMQTNIRSRDKAQEACKIWHQRELDREQRTTDE